MCSLYGDLSSLNPFFVSLSFSFHLSFPPSLLACLLPSFYFFLSLCIFPFFFLLFLMNLCLCKICPNIYKRKCWVVKLNSEKMLHMLKKCIQQGFQMFPHAFLSSVSSVGARYFVPLFRQNSHWKGSEIQAGVCSSGAVILDWFHLILAMGDWLKSLNNQWGWVRALCNGPVPGQGLCHLSPSWDKVASLSGTAEALSSSEISKKTSARLHWDTAGPWRRQDKKTHTQLCHHP